MSVSSALSCNMVRISCDSTARLSSSLEERRRRRRRRRAGPVSGRSEECNCRRSIRDSHQDSSGSSGSSETSESRGCSGCSGRRHSPNRQKSSLCARKVQPHVGSLLLLEMSGITPRTRPYVFWVLLCSQLPTSTSRKQIMINDHRCGPKTVKVSC